MPLQFLPMELKLEITSHLYTDLESLYTLSQVSHLWYSIVHSTTSSTHRSLLQLYSRCLTSSLYPCFEKCDPSRRYTPLKAEFSRCLGKNKLQLSGVSKELEMFAEFWPPLAPFGRLREELPSHTPAADTDKHYWIWWFDLHRRRLAVVDGIAKYTTSSGEAETIAIKCIRLDHGYPNPHTAQLYTTVFIVSGAGNYDGCVWQVKAIGSSESIVVNFGTDEDELDGRVENPKEYREWEGVDRNMGTWLQWIYHELLTLEFLGRGGSRAEYKDFHHYEQRFVYQQISL